jgi:hypothetical protein
MDGSVMTRTRRVIRGEEGTTLIETMVAAGMLVVMLVGLLSMTALATVHTENQGHIAARTAEYAQDKMEQLMALKYSDTSSDTSVYPAGTGGVGLTPGGSSDPSARVAGYVDWLGEDGGLLGGSTTPPTSPAWRYERVWLVECVSLPTTACTQDPSTTENRGLMRITVTVKASSALGGQIAPKATVVALRAGHLP